MARRGKRRKSKGKRKSPQAAPPADAKTAAEPEPAEPAKPAEKVGRKTAELDVGWDDDGMDLPEVKSETEKAAEPGPGPGSVRADDEDSVGEDEEPGADEEEELPAARVLVDDTESAREIEDDDDDVFPPRNEPAPVPALRVFDRALGIAEQAVLCGLLIALIGTAVYSAIMGNLFNKSVDWSQEVIRYSVFFIAMIGAALAGQRQRMITMDIVTRMLTDRTRAYLRVGVAALVIIVCYLLYEGGMQSRGNEAQFTQSDDLISVANGIMALPIGAALIAVHYAIHLIIDVRYLAAGRIPPQPKGMQVH